MFFGLESMATTNFELMFMWERGQDVEIRKTSGLVFDVKGLLGCVRGQNKGAVWASWYSGRLKELGRMQGWKVCRLCGGYWGMCYLFRIRKRKDIFMKTNMMGDINTMRS